jgi:hypothetical protein
VKKLSNQTILTVAAAVVLLSLATFATAQNKITKRVQLSAKSGSAVFKDTPPVDDLTRVYVVRAAKNQRLKVGITFTGRGDADFSLKRPDDGDVAEENIINSK